MAASLENINHSHEGHRQRMKERFSVSGFDAMADHEVLEYILFYVFKQGNTNDVAHRLINEFGDINGVLEAPYESLIKIPGIKENAARYIQMFVPLFRRYATNKSEKKEFKEISDCGNFLLNYFIGVKEEKVLAVSLDSKCKLISVDTVCQGGLTSAAFNLRQLVEIGINRKAVAMIVAHNHPSGIALPSKEDIDSTIGIKNALSVIDITLLDHIIISDNDFISLAQSKGFKSIFTE